MLDEFLHNIKDDINNISFVSGGARGVDTKCREWCNRNCIDFDEITPINKEDKMSYLFRNVEILTLADEVLAFWDCKSKGTKFVIDYAKARGKKIKVITSLRCFE